MVLDRDDRGGLNDFIMVNGQKVLSPIRQEIVSLRGIVAGEYIVNIYHFAALTGQPVPVTVKVEKLNPKVQVVHYDTVNVRSWRRRDNRGALPSWTRPATLTEVNHDQTSLVQMLNKRYRERKAG